MKQLILNAGNSRTGVWLWNGSEDLPRSERGGLLESSPLKAVVELATEDLLESNGHAAAALAAVLEERREIPLVVVSVVPEVGDLIRRLRPEAWVVGGGRALPFPSDIPDLAGVGPDRICNAAAVQAAGLSDALVVDAGTATTFDLVHGGVFRGGLIAPGLGFAADQLGARAALLRPVPLGPCPLEIGRDTNSAMATGSWHVGTRGIEGVVRGLLDRYGPLPVILTGGWGAYLGTSEWCVDLDWTLRGAAYLSYQRNSAP